MRRRDRAPAGGFDERLAMLLEEAAEAIHISGKILRHGRSSVDPTGHSGITNMDMLEEEIGHVLAIVEILLEAGDVDCDALVEIQREKLERMIERGYVHDKRNINTIQKILNRRKPGDE